jgi:hypothetical protein
MSDPRLRDVNIALHKYCYADIQADSDVEDLFRHYQETTDRLRRERPDIRFVHMTTPLTRVQSGPKAVIKKLLGRAPDHYAANMRREVFNDLLREAYAGSGSLFDLAAIESTRPDGRRESIRLGGRTSYALVAAYTTDGGHLNRSARRLVAEQLLIFLAQQTETR